VGERVLPEPVADQAAGQVGHRPEPAASRPQVPILTNPKPLIILDDASW
jgi:hypothetical protein